MTPWETAADGTARAVYTCETEDCEMFDEPHHLMPGDLRGYGAPMCGECGHELIFQRIEVRS
jgi:hypothetical protein